jgi:hypothetical protein
MPVLHDSSSLLDSRKPDNWICQISYNSIWILIFLRFRCNNPLGLGLKRKYCKSRIWQHKLKLTLPLRGAGAGGNASESSPLYVSSQRSITIFLISRICAAVRPWSLNHFIFLSGHMTAYCQHTKSNASKILHLPIAMMYSSQSFMRV